MPKRIDNLDLSIEDLSKELVSMFGDRESESKCVIKLARMMSPYRFSNHKTLPDVYTRFITKVAFAGSDCWYWYGASHKLGYGLMSALGESKAHRVSWKLHYGEIPEGLMVLHKCDVRNCVNPDHLFLGTHKDNMQDMSSKGRGHINHLPGELSSRGKLTNLQAQEIREQFAHGDVLQKELARKYSVSPMAISRIIRKETYV